MVGLAPIHFRRAAVLVAACAIIGLSLPAQSGGPAVSDVNTKISVFGGGVGSKVGGADLSDGLGGLAASLTMPLSYSFGLQIDGAYARLGDENFGNVGAHVFWRDPTVGLFGVYQGYAYLDEAGGIGVGRTGIEAQYFLDRVTLDGAVGAIYGDVDTDVYARARLQVYPVDDLLLQGGFIYEDQGFATAGMEYQLSPEHGLSVFADGMARDGDDYSVLGGLKITFGQSMSLKDRHRRQDPDNYVTQDLQTTQRGAAEKSKTSDACPFVPYKESCELVQLAPRTLPRIGIVPRNTLLRTVGAPSNTHLGQCLNAGYNVENPGPPACGCAQVFVQCFESGPPLPN